MDKDAKPPTEESNEDLELMGYQDGLDTDETIIDELTLAETDDPVETFGVPEDEFADELDGLAIDEKDDDDIREFVEDADEHDNNPAPSVT